MNLTDFKTLQDITEYGNKFLSTTNIRNSPDTGNNRIAILLDFEASFRREQITLYVGVFELKNNELLIGRSIIPYEEVIIANDDNDVDMETFQLTPKDQQDPNKLYMGEFSAYVYLTKNTNVPLWGLFKSAIENSNKLKIIS